MTGTTSAASPDARAEGTDQAAATARATWDTYTESWKVPAAEKRALYQASLAVDCVYVDPLVDLAGWDALEAYMADYHRQIPGGYFVTRWFQTHHSQCIAAWDMVAGDGSKVGEGISHAHIGDGKLTAMTGFFDSPAA
jgi:hypothetical protein